MCVDILIEAWAQLKPWYEGLFPGRVLVIGSTQRTPIEQLTLFCQGRFPIEQARYLAGKDVDDEIVTWKDGFVKTSKHNCLPLSHAFDTWIKIDGEYVWDEKYFLPLGRFVQEKYLGRLKWGGDFGDFDHIETI